MQGKVYVGDQISFTTHRGGVVQGAELSNADLDSRQIRVSVGSGLYAKGKRNHTQAGAWEQTEFLCCGNFPG
jgi:hypothetical protein